MAANNPPININPLFGNLPYQNIGPHSLTIHTQVTYFFLLF